MIQPRTHLKNYEKLVIGVFGSLILFVLGCFVYIQIYSSDYIYQSFEEVPDTPVAIVLGAAVASGGPTLVLSDRMTTAISLYEAGKIKKIFVSGDDTRIGYREAAPMKKFLVEKGIPETAVIVDPKGVDTYATMYHAHRDSGIGQAVIITQNFHLPRAVFLARSIGIDAYGLSADKRQYLLKNSFREIFANVKAVLDLTLLKYRGTMQE